MGKTERNQALQLRWSDLSKAPELPGLYAWYYRPLLTAPDVRLLVDQIELEQDRSAKNALVRRFLEKHVFSTFKELPYRVEISGQLKPKFNGMLNHQPTISDGLLDRIACKPMTAWDLKELFDSDLHFLSSPLYIGMAQNLRSRLRQHQHLIQELRVKREINGSLEEDSAFANTVVAREMHPSQLSVCVQTHESGGKVANLENLLNRVFFPIFGRN